jgi:hypothetical protein
MTEAESLQPKKRKKKSIDSDNDESESEDNDAEGRAGDAEGRAGEELQKESYFDSTEARRVFVSRADNPQEGDCNSALDVVKERVRALQSVNMHPEGWRELVNDADTHDCMTIFEIFCLRAKSAYLTAALNFAIEKMNGWTWSQCCDEAVKLVNSQGYSLAKSARTVMRWHHIFATGGNKFPNPNPVAAGGQKPLPFFFEKNPMAKELFTKYADSNLNLLSSGFMTEYVNSTLIPILLKEQNKNLAEEEKLNRRDFMLLNGFLKNSKTPRLEVAQRTVLNWMNKLRYKYCKVTKHYFNDKHEEKTNVLYRNDFIKRYFNYERRSYRWSSDP